MFNLFKKKFIDETFEEQKKDVLNLKYTANTNDDLINKILNGDSCDEIAGSVGEFGKTLTNPIPVNGPVGEIKYLNRLRNNNVGFIFHRIGSVEQENISGNVDVFEIVSIDGKKWDILYLNFYHPRRSTKAPDGYHFSEFHNIFSKIPFGYGTNHMDRDFPFGIGKFIEIADVMGMGKIFSKKFNKIIEDKNKFIRDNKHKQNLSLAKKLVEHTKNISNPKTNLTDKDILKLNEFFKNRNFKDARQFLDIKNKQYKDDYKILFYLGYLYRNLEDYEKSIKFYIEAMKVNPFDPILSYSLGIVYQNINDYNSAIKFFEKSISLNPNFMEAINSLALTYKKQGDFENALKYYNQCIEVLFQNIFNQIKENKISEIDDLYTKSKSEKWFETAINIATKNSSLEGMKNIKFPAEETADKLNKENPYVGYSMYDKDGVRYILPTYFCNFYNMLRSDLFYSNVLNNIASLFGDKGDIEQARKIFKESIEFIPVGIDFSNPYIGLEELDKNK